MPLPTDAPRGPPPVRLLAPARSPTAAAGRVFAGEGPTVLARVKGDGLRAFDVRDGDHVVLVHRERAEHGDLATVLEPDGRAHLWKVYPDADGLRLSLGHPAFERRVGANARVQGVVVAVLRRLHETPPRCE